MTSNSEETNMLRVVIYGKLLNLPMDVPNADVVRVSRVPKSMSWVRPEAFTRHCVGLGPYHHFDSELIMTDELKLSVANRVDCVKALLPKDASNDFVFNSNIIEDFYHTDGQTRCDNLMYVLAVDGLFLLAFLLRDAGSNLS
ncbi:hypothetical protein VNO78_07277 [Psophocarpus tetragonolobus]|uniref:Uncharacterized protein n=1 Tax=Psophocarpus tetragonolobus TaxID=3891 RepID=A0AAN9T2R7_PSOTE